MITEVRQKKSESGSTNINCPLPIIASQSDQTTKCVWSDACADTIPQDQCRNRKLVFFSFAHTCHAVFYERLNCWVGFVNPSILPCLAHVAKMKILEISVSLS